MTRRFPALGLLLASGALHAQPFALDTGGRLPHIVTEPQVTARLAGDLLGRDLRQLTGLAATRSDSLDDCRRRCIVIGTAASPLVEETARAMGVDLAPLAGQQERYIRAAGRLAGRELLLIAGADRRGAVYGVVDASRELGVSPWEWWADVRPTRRGAVALDGGYRLSPAPSVAYRGIFINDEDWGLQPWAARTFDPAGDIGPATYARVFELMWRLKANLIWPAMHDSTRAFYTMPGNAQAADDYAIVVGSSHAEPMLRNNVGEWKKSDGAFNFFSNRERLLGYWQERIDQVKGFENVYTLGLRGVHDSAMEGATSPQHARDTVQQVVQLQRDMLGRSLGKPAGNIPTVLTMYKEVLDYYNLGLQVPDDVSLVWPDDNYGYLHQLGTAKEAARPGGNGIYYHISYWGRPHDYLWLGTTHPALIRDQLQRAWTTGARRLWVLNVGDIKPGEYLTQYFLDAAFDAGVLRQDPARHLAAWAAQGFGAEHAGEIAAIQQEYYRLAWERRPEFMGWSQTEPTRPVRRTDYVRSGGDEAERRLARYAALVARAEALERRLPAALRDAWFQLVLYPVRASANLNRRILKLDLAAEYALQGRPSPARYVRQAREAHAALVADTAAYNALGKGKWARLMDMAPRRLPVFAEPAYPSWSAPSGPTRRGCGLVYPAPHSSEANTLVLPRGRQASRSLTLVGYGGTPVAWSAAPGAAGLRADIQHGQLDAANGYEQRLTLAYDGSASPSLSLRCGGKTVKLNLQVQAAASDALPAERERIVVLPAGSASAGSDWEPQPGLGTSGRAMRARLDLPAGVPNAAAAAATLAYRFQTSSEGGATLRFVAVPVHALTSEHRLRIAVQLDDGPLQTLDYTTVGRSDEWKQNVLSNMAVRTTTVARLAPGPHTLRVFALDPGVVLDRVDVVMDGAPHYYGMPPSD
ncbi:glycosyl hydrolase 115 family protein [Massilia sp. UMI-21]|nr:glycosyl hydrolase 115 family protein [Massilia sp. UMI-21]